MILLVVSKRNKGDVGMKIIVISLILVSCSLMYAFIKKDGKVDILGPLSIYDYSASSIDGTEVDLKKYKGKKIIIVNVASKCGFTPQYKELQEIYDEYKDTIEILGFPSNDFLWQEPGKNSDIKKFCSSNYGITFPLFEKIAVKKKRNQHPIYTWLSHKELNGWNNKAPSWNFCKYLIDENGKLVNYYSSSITPKSQEMLNFINR